MMNQVSKILNHPLVHIGSFELTLLKVLMVVLFFVVAHFLSRTLRKVLLKFFKDSPNERGRAIAISQIARYIIITGTILLSLQSIGLNISLLLASSAALFVGLGFGLQTLFNDLIAGITLLVEGSIKVGDVVDLKDESGVVESIGIRKSHIKTRSNIIIIVPNSFFTNDKIVNWSHNNQLARFMVSVGVAFGSDTKLVKEILLDVAKSHPKVSPVFPPNVRFENFGDSSLDFELFFWSDEFWRIEDVQSDIRFEIDRIFREKGITIPFPQRDLHIKQMPTKA